MAVSEFLRDRAREFCSVFAERRGERPLDFAGEEGPCPFCPGNESMTPPEIGRVGDPWKIRVFPNKYPATDCHEVIVDSPAHWVSLSELSDEDLATAIGVWRERTEKAYRSEQIRYVSLFHNHGMTAGASRKHIHTQLIGLPFLPPAIEREVALYEDSRCPVEEIATTGHAICEESGFVAFCPAVSRFPYETWIIPADHRGLLPEETSGLARILKKVLTGIVTILSGPDYNLIVKTMPSEWHWRAEIIPRTGFMAGFELDTGCHILSVAPARAAEELTRAIATIPS